MIFVTFPWGGEQWLERRLQAIPQLDSNLSVCIIDAAMPLEKRAVVNQLKCSANNDVGQLEDTNVFCLVRNPLAAIGSAGSDIETCQRTIDAMVSFAIERCLPAQVVRVEDFAAFPIVTLRRLCESSSTPCSIPMARAFLNADRPIRRSNLAATRNPEARGEADKFDLFSWVDRLPPWEAIEIADRYVTFLEMYYPEVLRFCRTQPAIRRAS